MHLLLLYTHIHTFTCIRVHMLHSVNHSLNLESFWKEPYSEFHIQDPEVFFSAGGDFWQNWELSFWLRTNCLWEKFPKLVLILSICPILWMSWLEAPLQNQNSHLNTTATWQAASLSQRQPFSSRPEVCVDSVRDIKPHVSQYVMVRWRNKGMTSCRKSYQNSI